MGSGQLSAADAPSDSPSAELLLYLAEFGSDEGEVVDPIAVAKALERSEDSGQNADPESPSATEHPGTPAALNPEVEHPSRANPDSQNELKPRP